MFSLNSRYFNMPVTKIETPDGRKIVYVRRRFVPPPERFELLLEHVVTQGDRLDNVAAQWGVPVSEVEATYLGRVFNASPTGFPGSMPAPQEPAKIS